MAGPQQQTKRGAEAEAQPAPVAKRTTQEPEQQKDIQDGGAAVQQPASDTTNHVSWSLENLGCENPWVV
jgi:hypothetical protein